MLELILPAGVESEERFGEAPGGVLFPEEEQIIAHAVEARRREYATVRSCARACLEPAGICAGSDPARCGRCTHLAGRDTGQHDPLRRLRRRSGRPDLPVLRLSALTPSPMHRFPMACWTWSPHPPNRIV